MTFVGGVDVLQLTLDVYDGTTSATVTVTGPSAQILTPPAASVDGGQTWTATPSYDEAGRWVATWTVTGVGATKFGTEIWVSDLPTPGVALAWRPELWHVAAYVPRRTIVGAVDGFGVSRKTFDDTTTPSNAEVANLITDACNWVAVAAGTIDASLTEAARGAASRYAAGLVELTYPDNGDDLNTADILLKQAEQMRRDLAAANIAITVDDPATDTDNLLPVWSFPSPPGWGDALL